MDFNVEEGTVLKPLIANNIVNKEMVYTEPFYILLNLKPFGVFEVSDEKMKL
jgi:hypothetical protein